MILNKINNILSENAIQKITNWISQKLSYSITIKKNRSRFESLVFDRVIEFLKKLDNDIFDNNKAFKNHPSINSFNILNEGNYCIIKKSCLILISISIDYKKKNNVDTEMHTLKLNIYGPGLNYFKDKIELIISKEHQKYINKRKREKGTHFEYASFENGRLNIFQSDKLFFNYIISKEKNQIFNHIEKWCKSKLLYNKYSITHKTGILLYGKPGTGKSSMVKAIATHFKCKVAIISKLEEISECISQIKEERDYANKKRHPYLIVFEDIDCMLNSRETELDKTKKNTLDGYYAQLINFLDGMGAPTNTIFVATTNYIDRIDPAFIRDGRFNLKIEMEYFEEDDVKEMCELYGVDYNIIKDKITTPICPASCQKIILEKLEESI